MIKLALALLMQAKFLNIRLSNLCKWFNNLGIMSRLGRGTHVGTVTAQEVHPAVFRNEKVFAHDRLGDRLWLFYFDSSVDLVWKLPAVTYCERRVSTYDDGYRDLHRNAFERHKQYSPRVLSFVVFRQSARQRADWARMRINVDENVSKVSG
ncbi:hypothetical protein [Cypionkella sp. TWP1-2-1b2]|uniref:hypothetical protein n=1 Tax=Cypionkella sp. TWP1-2-1b2 TaxID=2804675 RepID=UPI003CF89CF5